MSKQVGYYWNSSLSQRESGVLCPEKPVRNDVLNPESIDGLSKAMVRRSFSSRGESILGLVHTAEHIEFVRSTCAGSKKNLDRGDTAATKDTFEQALLSASAGCDAVDAVMKGELSSAFCAVRPPGHHANAIRSMAYCVFNNVAIAARYAQQTHQVDRVLIVDWDNDPGNGTQEIFWQDETVFLLSYHQSDLFPQAGAHTLIGDGPGRGFNRNVSMAPGTTVKVYLSTFENILSQVMRVFSPGLVIISAGFDAHHTERASKQALRESDFARMTEIVHEVTFPHCGGRIVSILEGGYNTATLPLCVKAHCHALVSVVSVQKQDLATSS